MINKMRFYSMCDEDDSEKNQFIESENFDLD